ncbi:MAG TPA: hypothetical protein PKZ66_07490 [Chitinophagaceae bacterium]|nr:hypothetical protein [Chitinophagaceae bacterium]
MLIKVKTIFACICILITANSFAQLNYKGFLITGNIKQDIFIGLDEIAKTPSVQLKDIVITNHLNVPQLTAKNLKGFLLKEILSKVILNEPLPRKYSEFYFTFIAQDSFTAVFSWNEIFNSPTGNNLFIITQKDGKSVTEMPESVLILTATDFTTGRRYIKKLSAIIVSRAK